MAPPLVSVIIVNWNGLPVVRRCLDGLERTRDGVDLELLVADNGSTDGSLEFIREHYPWARIVANSENQFFARPNNVLASMATGRYLFFMNNDIILQPHCLQILLEVLEAHPEAGAVAPQLLYPDGRVQPSCRRLPTYRNLIIAGLQLERFFPASNWKMTGWGHDDPVEVEQPMMSAFLVRRECWEETGPLDEGFPLYFNDVDWCRRCAEAGWRIRFEPQAKAVHYEAWSGRRLGFRQARLSAQGLRRYMLKYGSGGPPGVNRLLTECLCCGLLALWAVKRVAELITQGREDAGK